MLKIRVTLLFQSPFRHNSPDPQFTNENNSVIASMPMNHPEF